MPKLESYQLIHPELLSKFDLCEILKSSCIKLQDFDKLSKDKLIEIYNRVALPLPQRNNKSNSNSNDSESNSNIETSCDNPLNVPEEALRKINGVTNSYQNRRLKPPTNNVMHTVKKICLSNIPKQDTQKNFNKRQNENEINLCEIKKRKKITWP